MTDITENGKYYIPTIEEFHEGFEYELQVPEKRTWSKEIFYLNESHIQYVRCVNIQDEHTHNKIRVKHLDHDDIISLGWNQSDVVKGPAGYECILYTKYYNDIRGIHNKLRMAFIYKKHWLCIDLVYGDEESLEMTTLRFSGTIKNKSELQRLMKQLGL